MSCTNDLRCGTAVLHYHERNQFGEPLNPNGQPIYGRLVPVVADVDVLRRLLWQNHGHTGLYGDDGEMQCHQCPLDFKRDPVALIAHRLAKWPGRLDA